MKVTVGVGLKSVFRLGEGFSVLYLAKRHNTERTLLISAESESLNNISFLTLYESNHHETLQNISVYTEELSSIIIERILVCSIVISAHSLSSCSNACVIQWSLKYSLEHSAL